MISIQCNPGFKLPFTFTARILCIYPGIYVALIVWHIACIYSYCRRYSTYQAAIYNSYDDSPEHSL